MSPVIVIFGAGAIGGYFGGRLAQTGQDVTLIDPWPEHIETVRSRGLHIEGMTADEEAVVKVKTKHLTEVQSFSKGPLIDIAVVATKSYDTLWATTLLRPYLAPGGFVVSLQNCINEETIASVVGWGNTVGCVVRMAAELIGPGHILRTGGKRKPPQVEFRFGEPHGRITPRVKLLAEMAKRSDGAEPTTNLWGERWSKLCLNAIGNGISAATGLRAHHPDNPPAMRRLAIRIGGEVVRTGQALGYDFSHIGTFAAERMAFAAEGDLQAFNEADEWLRGEPSAYNRSNANRTSMAQDMIKGRRTEIEFMNGYIAQKAASVGLHSPANLALVDLVKAVERGEKKQDPERVVEIEQTLAPLKKAS